ncbi:MAG: hypothetical protein ACRCYQ_02175 [Nocardioides sp.]
MTLTLALALSGLAGCGDSEAGDAVARDTTQERPVADGPSPSDPADTPAEDVDTGSWPSCERIWVAGNRLPQEYAGCLDDRTPIPADLVNCSQGGLLVTYDDRFYALTGGPVNQVSARLAEDRQFTNARAACGA